MSEVNITNFEGVYEPAEDSWLMANHLPDLKGPVLEIGCGTGIVSISLAKRGLKVTAVDKNPKAVEATRFNSINNNVEIEILEGNMFTPVSGRKFGTIVCNPPYLPPPNQEYQDSELTLAVEGGAGGTEFTESLLSEAATYLETGGSMYLIISSRMDNLKGKWIRKTIHQEKFFFERLTLECFDPMT